MAPERPQLRDFDLDYPEPVEKALSKPSFPDRFRMLTSLSTTRTLRDWPVVGPLCPFSFPQRRPPTSIQDCGLKINREERSGFSDRRSHSDFDWSWFPRGRPQQNRFHRRLCGRESSCRGNSRVRVRPAGRRLNRSETNRRPILLLETEQAAPATREGSPLNSLHEFRVPVFANNPIEQLFDNEHANEVCSGDSERDRGQYVQHYP
jgi:hypothetical protein